MVQNSVTVVRFKIQASMVQKRRPSKEIQKQSPPRKQVGGAALGAALGAAGRTGSRIDGPKVCNCRQIQASMVQQCVTVAKFRLRWSTSV